MNTDDRLLTELLHRYTEGLRPLTLRANLAHWHASISGSDRAFQERKDAENQRVGWHGDREVFAELCRHRRRAIADPQLRRQLEVAWAAHLPYQADPTLSRRIVELEADLEQIFNTHRSIVRGTPRTENEIRRILRESDDDAGVCEAWQAYMTVGRKVRPLLLELVGLRNQVAATLGYRDYFALQLALQELDESELFAIFDELDRRTAAAFARLMRDIAARRAAHFGIAPDQLRPWHLGDLFFQEAPPRPEFSLDPLIENHDPVALSVDHYHSIGLDVDGILAASDLYEKPGKSPHAFCTSIDRHQDVRILCNIRPNSYWLDTLHHELGHAVYDRYIADDVPFLLREPSHILTTEGIAMLFGALTRNPEFLRCVLKLEDADADRCAAAAAADLRAEKLIFSRWTQVMLRFEQALYADPAADLNRLWWQLKERYQLQRPPDDCSGSDYGAKMHVVAAPVYYHNYMLGELFACQLHAHMAARIVGVDDPATTCFYGRPEAGAFLRQQVFEPGNRYRWDELTRRVSAGPLTAAAFARMYLD